jgi:AmmeMemoRadiSam system protein A
MSTKLKSDVPTSTHPFTLAQQTQLLKLARQAIAHYLATGETLLPDATDPALGRPAGAFVTLRQRPDGVTPKPARLRGCIGHVEGERPLNQVIADMAIKAATQDPRFPSVSLAELDGICLEISVLSPLEPLTDVNQIELGVHGLVIVSGWRRGLLLPQVPIQFGWTREEFLAGICRKASLEPDAWQTAELFTFTTTSFEETGD